MVIKSVDGVKYHFGDRSVEDVESLQLFLDKNKIFYDKIVSAKQVHSDNIKIIDPNFQGIYECDGLITREKGIVLTLYTADCMPVFFMDNSNKTIGAAHCGWKGTYKNISARMIEKFVNIGSRLENIKVTMGPVIGPCCYPIFGRRYEEIIERYGKWSNEIIQFYNGRAGLNLLRWNYLQLLSCGIDPAQINHTVVCTSCERKKYYSYHRGDRHVRMIHFILNDKGV